MIAYLLLHVLFHLAIEAIQLGHSLLIVLSHALLIEELLRWTTLILNLHLIELILRQLLLHLTENNESNGEMVFILDMLVMRNCLN